MWNNKNLHEIHADAGENEIHGVLEAHNNTETLGDVLTHQPQTVLQQVQSEAGEKLCKFNYTYF